MILFYVLVFFMPRGEDSFWGQHVGGLTLVKYLGILCTLYAAFYLTIRRRSAPYFQTSQAKCFLAFFFIASVSYLLRGPGFSWQTKLFFTYFSFLMLLFVTITIVNTSARFRWVLIVGTGGIAFAAVEMLREWRWYGYNSLFRPSIGVGNPNDFAAMANLFVPVVFYWVLAKRSRAERLFFLCCLMLTLGGIAVSASRGGFLGLAVGLLYLILHARKRARNLALAGMLLVSMSLTPISPVRRLLHPTRGDQASTESRQEVWRAGLRMIRAHPFLGVGVGNFKPLSSGYAGPDLGGNELAHNTYIEVCAEMGVLGLFAFLAIIYFSFQTLVTVRRQAFRLGSAFLHQAALGMQAGLLGCSIAIFFSSLEYIKPFWLVIFLTMCLPSLLADEKRKQAKESGRTLVDPSPQDASSTLSEMEMGRWLTT